MLSTGTEGRMGYQSVAIGLLPVVRPRGGGRGDHHEAEGEVMSEFKHTPGPWHTGTDEDANVVYGPNLECVVECGNDDGDAERERADARLIAAAPAMLSALRTVSEKMDQGTHPDVWFEVLAAIRLATGG
jgi:hypothetical protein